MTKMTWQWAALGAAVVMGCGGDGVAPIGPGCDDLGSGTASTRASTVISAADAVVASTMELTGDLEVACASMADDLGVSVPMPSEGERQVEATCGAVAGEIESVLAATLPAGSALEIQVLAPECSLGLDAAAMCAAECDASLEGSAEVMCTEGRLVGSCEGTCSGSCRIEGSVTCAAECRGTCSGSCAGICNGSCEGTCSQTNAAGECIGTCEGTCMGTCSAECTGTCEGTCVSDVEGMCMGQCAGSCSVEMEAPRCEGDASIMAEADCQAACDAEVRANAECTEPRVVISLPEGATLDEAELDTLVSTLQAHWPAFVSAQARLQTTVDAAEDLASATTDLARSGDEIGAQAAACLGVAADSLASAVGDLQASVRVSVEVSASVSATGST